MKLIQKTHHHYIKVLILMFCWNLEIYRPLAWKNKLIWICTIARNGIEFLWCQDANVHTGRAFPVQEIGPKE